MSWIFGSIDFEAYGVYVAKSTGVLDLPKLRHNGHDWLDEDGLDYWQDDTQYEDRKIVLNCFMVDTAGYSSFKTKWQAFTSAVKAEGKVSFTTPFFSIDDCSIGDGVNLIRETNYVDTIQVGTFSLIITVNGDPDYNLISFTHWTPATGTVVKGVAKTKNARITKDLQGDQTLSLSFESNTKLDIHIYTTVSYAYDGSHSDLFLLTTEPNFVKKSTNKYVYSLTLQSYIKILEKSQFLNDLLESDFSYYGNMEDIVDLIITNHGRTVFGKFTKGTVVSTLNKNHKFSAENCLEVLKRIASEYELEFEFEKSGANYLINVKEKVANDLAVTLEYGKGNGLYELTRGARIEDEYFNRLFAYGASKNLPQGYRSGLRRLSFDANPLEDIPTDYSGSEKEATIFFDDIYPRRTGTVTGYTQTLEADLTTAQKEVWPNGLFVMTDSSIDFDINDYLLGGLTAKVVMKTGDLAGYEFDISKYDHDTKEIFIIPYKDERGELLPSEVLQIGVGDEYTLINIDMPESYVVAAENELQEAAADALAEGSAVKFEYSAIIDPKFVADNSLYFEVGDRITIIDTDFGVDGTFRISRLVYNDYTKKYELTLSEKRRLNRIQTIERVLETHERTNEATDADTVESQRDNVEDVTELHRTLLDPLDEKLNVDRIVRDNSLDPGMLSLDNELTFYLDDATIEPNIDGDEDAVRVNPGSITITNWNPLPRYEIQKLKDNGGTYDPTRTWVIPETDITLETKSAHWLYAKLDLTEGSTDCTIEAHITHIEGKELIGDNYLYKRLANITAGEE